MINQKIKLNKLPDSPGVYKMKDKKGSILYVGKAANLRRRVSSYFTRPHDSRIQMMVNEIVKVDYKKTDTAIEALILEAELIKKLSPPFNVREKDDTSFLFVEFTKEKFPRVLLVRGRDLPRGERFGPFTSATSIREALKILRRIFPFSLHESGKIHTRPCFDYEIGLCPGTCVGLADRKEYLKNIKNLKLLFKGKKKKILRTLLNEMKKESKALEFEKAEKTRRQIFSLKHIQDIAVIHDEVINRNAGVKALRIEGYDISNISGTSAVGSMVVFKNEEPDKSQYRKFRIKTVIGSNDVGMLREMLRRRFKRAQTNGGWPLPDLIVMDGGMGQVNAGRAVLKEYHLRIPLIGIAKGPERKRNDIIGLVPPQFKKSTLIRVRDESHRFAIAYHKRVRGKEFLSSRTRSIK